MSVASERLKKSMLRSWHIRSIMMSLISRAVSLATTRPARIWPELDPVGDLDDPVEHSEASVADVVDDGVGADAQVGGDPAGRGRLEVFAADAAVDQGADLPAGGTSAISRARRAASAAPSDSR